MTANNSFNFKPTAAEPAFRQEPNQDDRKRLPLSSLVPGQLAEILRVGGNRFVRLRLMEMGFIRGESVFVERVAPLGDPIEYRIKGYHLSLRRADAQHILVQPIALESND